jgi:negative regulator of flagellin synthesis FlgM
MVIKGAAYIVDLSRPDAIARESGSITSAPAAQSTTKGGDRVDISSRGLELEKLKRDLDALPDLRLDRVALAKQNMQEGGYRVAPGVVAQKMMEAFGSN